MYYSLTAWILTNQINNGKGVKTSFASFLKMKRKIFDLIFLNVCKIAKFLFQLCLIFFLFLLIFLFLFSKLTL